MAVTKEVLGFHSYLNSRSPRTAAAYTRDVMRFLAYAQKSPEKVSLLDISAWFEDLRTKGYSERSIARFSWGLRKFFNILGRRDISELIEVPMYMPKEPKWLPKDRIEHLLNVAEGKAKVMLTTAYELALRVGELELLERSFFNAQTGQIKVFRLKHKGHPNEYILQLSKQATELLVQYVHEEKTRSSLIFPVSTRLVTYYYRKTAPKAEIDPYEYTFHSLRHSRITHIAIDMIQNEGKVDEVRLAKFAGHIRYETTLLYVHLASEYLAFKR